MRLGITLKMCAKARQEFRLVVRQGDKPSQKLIQHRLEVKSRQEISGALRSYLLRGGNLNNSSLNNAGSNGNYWSSTPNGSSNAYNLNFNSGNVNTNNNNRYNGFSVRCVAAG